MAASKLCIYRYVSTLVRGVSLVIRFLSLVVLFLRDTSETIIHGTSPFGPSEIAFIISLSAARSI